MNRILFSLAALLGALVPLVFDSALKGAALLAVAALCALVLYRASAATRHLVWLVAVVTLLIVPVLSVALPQWRVLPKWAAAPVVEPAPAVAMQGTEWTQETKWTGAPAPAAPAAPAETITPPAAPAPAPTLAAPAALIPHPVPTWRDWLPLAWCAGFALLALRLLAAHVLLRRASRNCPALTSPPDETIAAAFANACKQLGIRQRVTLLLDERRTIPVVWGVFRPRLMLPIEARGWTDDQLRSVLLHELAHIRRRDTLVQWLTQIACALHWWNPLVWLAAWRLHVERERACDDLVLASGVRPSAYAEHLLDIATKLSPARWTQACGLAMARKSSLESRLLAVLSEKLNRRRVSATLAAVALLLGAGIAIPVAMLRAADEKWNPPSGAHILGNDFSSFCIHDGKDTTFVIAYHGDFDSTSRSSSNAKARTWNNDVTLIAKKPGIALTFLRTHAAPGKLSITTAPAEARDLSKPAPPPRAFGQKEYDLAKGRVFLLTDTGLVRQFDIATPPVRDRESADKLAALIAAIPPQEREEIALKPKHKDARALYEIWQRHARLSGDIPGALIGELAAAVKVFIGYNPTWETVPTLNALLPRLDATRDWKSADAIALLDEVAAVKDSPLSMAMRRGTRHTIRNGEALPEKFADAPWGEAQPNGLRAAWVLEPGAAEIHRLAWPLRVHRIGAALRARLLVQNTGSVPVVLQAPTFHQGGVKATDAKDAEVQVSGISWTTHAMLASVRLAPGEYIEIDTPGIGFGPRAGMGPWAGPRIGSSVLAKPGDEITLTHGPVPLDGSEVGMSEDDPHVIGPGWWLAHIKTRLSKELPLPADATERTRLLDRAVRELFSAAPTAEETAAFIADTTPDALDALIKRLAARTDVVSFSGKLPTAPAKFRVIAADPAADKTPRVVLGPGEYPLSGGTATSGAVTLKIVGRPVGDRRTNEAGLLFVDTEATGRVPLDPHRLNVPDGWGTWAIVCRPGEGFFYLLHEGTVRKIDYSAPRKVTDTPATELPAEFRDEVKRQLEAAGVSAEKQTEIFEKPAPPADGKAAAGGAEAKPPEREHLWNDKYAAVAFQTEKDVSFVLVYEGFISTGLSESFSQTSGKWSIEGNIHLVDSQKTKAAGKNVDKRVIAVKHTSDEPTKLYLDGKSYALGTGRVFVLGDAGEPFQTARSMALRSAEDLVKIGDAAMDDMKRARPAATPVPKSAEAGPRADEAPLQPKHESAQALLKSWQRSARTDGKIPGALIAALGDVVDWTLWTDGWLTPQGADQAARLAAMRFSHTRAKKVGPQAAAYVAKLTALRSRLDGSRDWTPAEAVAILDELTAITTEPVHLANRPFAFDESRKIGPGQPLPKELESAAWGAPAENGLRAAWLLEPAPVLVVGGLVPATENVYRHGSVLKARVLFHNAGKAPVVFETETWHQHDGHKALDGKGAEIPVKATWFTGITPMATFRLAPGEYCEVMGHGIAIGAGEYKEEHSTGSVGAVIEAKEGDTVTLTHTVDAAHGNDPKDPAELRKRIIAERVNREAPMPRAAADREQLIRRVTLDLTGVAPKPEDVAAFIIYDEPDALELLTMELQATAAAAAVPWSGKLPTGETKFRVIAADPNAVKAPRTANGPGRYVLGDGVHLLVSQFTEGDKPRTNKAVIAFLSPDPKVASPHKPHEIALPDGIGTYGIVWDRGSGALWVMQKGMVRKYEFANPSQVQEMKIEPGNILNIPAHLQEPMKKAFDVPGAPKQMPVKPATAGTPQLPKLSDDAYAKPGVHSQKFREEDAKRPGGELMGAVLEPSKPEDRDKEPLVLGVRTASDAQWRIGGTAKVGLVVRNRSASDVKFAYTLRCDNLLTVEAVDEVGKLHQADWGHDGLLVFQRMSLPAAHVAAIAEFTLRFDSEKRDVSKTHVRAFHLPPGKYKLRFK